MRSPPTWMIYAPKAGTVASTALLVLAVPPLQWSFLIWIGLVPWFFALRRCETVGQAVTQGFWLNLLSGLAGTFWVAYAAQRYLTLPLSAGVLALFIHAAIHQLQFVMFAGIYWKTLRGVAPASLGSVASLALLYTGLDWLTPKLFQDTLGMVLYSSVPLRQLAAIGGAPLLTFVVVYVNLAVYALLPEPNPGGRTPIGLFRPWGRRAAWLVTPLAVLMAMGMTEERRSAAAIRSPEQTLRVGIVQGNVHEETKRRWARGDAEAAAESLLIYLRRTQGLLDSPTPPELIVWPETAYPGVFRKPENDAQLRLNVMFDRFLARAGKPFAFGAYDREDRTDRRVLKNALYLVTPESEQPEGRLSPMQVYHKSILFPVGEYFPLLDEGTVRQWLPHSAHLSSGDGPKAMQLSGMGDRALGVAPLICYEDLFANHTTALARADTDLLLNVSNDSWFGDYGAARWHLMMATLRSIETRLPQIRATNSGQSAFILPNGDLHEVTRFGERAVRVFDVPIVQFSPTLRMRLGDWFGPLSLVLGVAWVIIRLRRRGDVVG